MKYVIKFKQNHDEYGIGRYVPVNLEELPQNFVEHSNYRQELSNVDYAPIFIGDALEADFVDLPEDNFPCVCLVTCCVMDLSDPEDDYPLYDKDYYYTLIHFDPFTGAKIEIEVVKE